MVGPSLRDWRVQHDPAGSSSQGQCEGQVHIAVFPGQQGHNSRPVRAIIGGQQAA